MIYFLQLLRQLPETPIQPVPINSAQILRAAEGEEPIVGHLIAVTATEPTRSLLGLPTNHGPLTLKLSNGTVLAANLPLGSISNTDGIYENPLMIVCASSLNIAETTVATVEQTMIKVLDERDRKASSCALSTFTLKKWLLMRNKTGLDEEFLHVDESRPTTSIPAYEWIDNVDEDNDLQRSAYMAYLNENLGSMLPLGFEILDVAENKSLLSVTDPRLPFSLSGGTDVLIVDQASIEHEVPMAGVRFVIELKPKIFAQKNIYQCMAELVAADMIANSSHSVIVLLTNLADNWRFMWLGEDKKVSMVKFKFAANAFSFIIQNLTSENGLIQAPVDIGKPSKRVKIHKLLPEVEFAGEDELERYELMADVLEPEYLIEKRYEYAQKVSREFLSMFA